MRISLLLCSALLLLTPAPVPAAEPTAEELNTAELKLFAGTAGLNASSFFEAYTGESCENGPGRLATFNFVTKKQQVERVPVGATLYVLGVAHVEPKSGEQMLKNVCRAMRSFVPQAGHTYEIRQDFTERNCPISVKDATAGTEVKTAKHKPTGKCKDKK